MAETRENCLKNGCGGVKKWNQDMKTSFVHFCFVYFDSQGDQEMNGIVDRGVELGEQGFFFSLCFGF